MNLHSDSPKGADISIPYGIRFLHEPQPWQRKSGTLRQLAIESAGHSREVAMFDRRGFLSSMMAVAGAGPPLSFWLPGVEIPAGGPPKKTAQARYLPNVK